MATSQSSVTFIDIPNFPGYRVGDDGSVWTCWRQKGLGGGRGSRSVMSRMHWRPMTQHLIRRYWTVGLRAGGRKHCLIVHHLVLESFVGPRPPGLWGLHRDDDRTNNRPSNLYWGTPSENAKDRERNGHGNPAYGTRHPLAKLNDERVAEVKRRLVGGQSLVAIAAEFGINVTTVRKIKTGRAWPHVPWPSGDVPRYERPKTGFALITPEQRQEVQRKAILGLVASGKRHRLTHEQAVAAGKKGAAVRRS